MAMRQPLANLLGNNRSVVFSGHRVLRSLQHRLSVLSRLDVLLHNLHSRIPPNLRGANAYVVPDVIPLSFDYGLPGLTDGHIKYYNDAVANGDVLIVWSEHTKQDVLRRVGGEPDHFRVCPLAIGPEFAPADPASLQRALAAVGLSGTKYVLCVATIEKRKNHASLIRAFDRMIRRDRSLPHKLVLVGRPWIGHEEVFALVDRLGLGDRVVHLDEVGASLLPSVYAGADVFVFPSLYEGFGLPPLEAMASGTPVLSSNATSLPEVVGNGAILFDPEDDDGLCEHMYQALTSPALRQQLVERGLARARHFKWKRTADQYLEALEQGRRHFAQRRS